MNTKKTVNKVKDQIKEPESPAPQEEPTPEPAPDITEPLTLESLFNELSLLRQMIADHTIALGKLQDDITRKRRPVSSSGKIQILDKQTGEIFPSKNNAYQSLLKAGKLKELVDKGLFGAVPEKNTFGWYVLVREWKDRFKEVQDSPQEGK